MHTVVNGTRIRFDGDGAGFMPAGTAVQRRPTLGLLHEGPGLNRSSFKPQTAC